MMAHTILAVDDDRTTLYILKTFLRSMGANVVTSSFPADIMALIGQTQPDVVLLDLLSPSGDMHGLGILGKLCDDPLRARVPVLLMSVNHAWLSALAPRLRELGVGVIAKPFDLDQLWQMVEQAVA